MIMLTVALLLALAPPLLHSGTMVDVVKGVKIPWDPDSQNISILTDSVAGSDEQVKVYFYDDGGLTVGAVFIHFVEPIKYQIVWCTYRYITFPDSLPTETEKTWVISYSPAELRITIFCNGVEVVNVELSSGCDYSLWRDTWGEQKIPTNIKFISWDTASDQYCLEGGQTWCEHTGKYLSGYSSGEHNYNDLQSAQSQCLLRSDCGGITYEPYSRKYTLRKGTDLNASPSSEISWMWCNEDDDDQDDDNDGDDDDTSSSSTVSIGTQLAIGIVVMIGLGVFILTCVIIKRRKRLQIDNHLTSTSNPPVPESSAPHHPQPSHPENSRPHYPPPSHPENSRPHYPPPSHPESSGPHYPPPSYPKISRPHYPPPSHPGPQYPPERRHDFHTEVDNFTPSAPQDESQGGNVEGPPPTYDELFG